MHRDKAPISPYMPRIRAKWNWYELVPKITSASLSSLHQTIQRWPQLNLNNAWWNMVEWCEKHGGASHEPMDCIRVSLVNLKSLLKRLQSSLKSVRRSSEAIWSLLWGKNHNQNSWHFRSLRHKLLPEESTREHFPAVCTLSFPWIPRQGGNCGNWVCL